jgi:VWFA-related protein
VTPWRSPIALFREIVFGMARNRVRAFALALGIAASALAWPAAGQTAKPGGYREEARVDRVILDAHVTDSHGQVITGLVPADFRVVVDGDEVPLEAADWISADEPEVPAPALAADEIFGAPAPPPQAAFTDVAPGRLIIFFFQTDHTPSRLSGLIRMGIQARHFLDTLLPTDRVAVLSFDSHLKLRQDFTADRARILAAVSDSLRTGTPPRAGIEPGPSLARHFDERGALRAVTPERSLALIAEAAEPIPGGKSLLFFGWGLQTIGGLSGPSTRDAVDLDAAMEELARARITIFTLDVTDADYHSLEGTLQQISDRTGGTYAKTNLFPGVALDRVRRAIAGRYVLVFRKPNGPRGHHEVHVSLAGKKGRVLARGYYED